MRLGVGLGVVALSGLGLLLWPRIRPDVKEPPQPDASTIVATKTPPQRFALDEAGERLGLSFRHDPGRPTFFYPEIMGAGLAVADFNRDGKLDVLLRGRRPRKGHPHPVPAPTTPLTSQQPAGSFRDASEKSGIADDGYGMGVAVGDVNNDGIPDVYLTNFGADKLYLGKGDGTFVDVTKSAGIANLGFASSACFVDF